MKPKTFIAYAFLGAVFLTAFSAQSFGKNNEQWVQYNNKIKHLSEQCSKVEATKTPRTLTELFCSPSPINNITARYCLHEKMVNNNDIGSIKSYIPSEESPATQTSVTVEIKCDSIKY